MKTKKANLKGILLKSIVVLFIALIGLTGCEDFSLSDLGLTADSKSYVTLMVSVSGERTIKPLDLMPSIYRAEFISIGNSEIEIESIVFEGDSKKIELLPGTYTLNLYGYLNAEQPPIAYGSREVTIITGVNTIAVVELELEPLTGDFYGTGIFEWDFSFTMQQNKINSADIVISRNGTIIENIDISSLNKSQLSLDTGYYSVTSVFKSTDGKKSVNYETLWIYPDLISTWNLTISNDMFFDDDGSVTINWSLNPDNPPVLLTSVKEVYQGDVVIFILEKKHNKYTFIVDGVVMQDSESESFTLNTENMKLGSHQIAIVGTNAAGIPWSITVRILVLKKEVPAVTNMAAVISGHVIQDTVVDHNGNIYLAAYISDGTNKAAVIKFSPDGNEVWRQTAIGTGRSYFNGIALAENNYLYICGGFTGSIGFGNGTVTGTSSVENPLLACFDLDGNNQWLKTSVSGSSYGGFGTITVDETGIYCAGMFYLTRDMGDGVVIKSNSWANFDSPWIIKYDFNGKTLWGVTSQRNRCASISNLIADNGTLYACGYTNGSGNSPFQWGNLAALNATGYNYNGWVAAFNADNGEAKWSSLAPVGGSSDFNGLAVKDGYLYAVGYADPSVAFLIGDTTFKGLLVKYDVQNGQVVWHKEAQVPGSRYYRIEADVNNFYVIGFEKTANIRKSILRTFDFNGNIIETRSVSGNGNSEYLNIFSNTNGIYITGYQSDTGNYQYDDIEGNIRGLSGGNNGVVIRYKK